MLDIHSLMQWEYAYGKPSCRGRFKQTPEAFRVDEILGFTAAGEGQHRMLLVEKRLANTEWVAKQLARFADIPARDVGYAGLKDRQACTTQWFSLDLAGKPEPDWSALALDGVTILEVHAHNKKLRKGSLQGNHFSICLQDICGDREELEARLKQIQVSGVPNYFGEQRFGHQGGNLEMAWEMFSGERKVKDRHKKGLYLSAARSLIFNRVLSQRIHTQTWQQLLPGEAVMLSGSHSFFIAQEIDETLTSRFETGDISPSGPLWGKGESPAVDQALAMEQEALQGYEPWLKALSERGLKQERRSLILSVNALRWQWLDSGRLQLDFELPAGSYATAVLRELVELTQEKADES